VGLTRNLDLEILRTTTIVYAPISRDIKQLLIIMFLFITTDQKTFSKLGKGFSDLLIKNKAYFMKKWGSSKNLESDQLMKRTLKHSAILANRCDTISLCMIMKNEEKRLVRCLESVKGLVHEIIIVDTGSTDNSIDIARSYGAKLFILNGVTISLLAATLAYKPRPKTGY